jgi:hypothetical protein
MAFLWGLRFDQQINILSSLLVVACGLPDVEWSRTSSVCQNSFIKYDTVFLETNYLEMELYGVFVWTAFT